MRTALTLAAVAMSVMSAQAVDTDALIVAAAARHQIPLAIARAVIEVESGGRCDVTGPGGSIGIMQVAPATAREVGVHGRLTDCANGLEAGMAYLARAIKAHADLCIALSAYNRGLYATPRCTSYGRRVIALADKAGGKP